jgi:hypothetical protein
MAWHIRTALGDVPWRAEAGIHLPDDRRPEDRINDVSIGLAAFGLG